jgi:hypothetical protein
MRLPSSFQPPPVLSRRRVWLSYTTAVVADGVQLLLGPIGFAFADEAIDVAMMIITSRLLGFHPLLLPAFILELVPLADLLPTWTGCVALVVALRKRQGLGEPPPPGPGSVIDV